MLEKMKRKGFCENNFRSMAHPFEAAKQLLYAFNLLQNLHLYTQKALCATSTRPFGEDGGNSPLQLSSRTNFAKIEVKIVIAKN